MAISHESMLAVMLADGGRIKNSELLLQFKGVLNCSDPVEKKHNRDLFKMIINNLAVVKDVDGVKYVVLKKKYQHLLKSSSADGNELKDGGGGGGGGDEEEKVEEQREEKDHKEPPDEKKSEQNPDSEADSSHTSSHTSFIEQALQRHTFTDFKVPKTLHFVTSLKSGTDDAQQQGHAHTSAPVRFALPLRMPPVLITPVAREEMENTKTPSNDNQPVSVHLAPCSNAPGRPCSPKIKRRSSVDSTGPNGAPLPRTHCKSVKPADEPKYSDTVPLESSEHEWMVTSASGRWALLYGLLLNDVTLAEKKDFISGFTALHWAAKSGNSEMLCNIIDLSRKTGRRVDINNKSFAGYTPLHIAAIHGNEYIIGILVMKYGANCNVRDNSGKKAHHYLDRGTSHSIRELLGGVKTVRAEPQKNLDDADTHKHSHTISRLFQPQTIGYRRKPKSRSTIASVVESYDG